VNCIHVPVLAMFSPGNPFAAVLSEMVDYVEEFGYYDPSRDLNLASELIGRPLITPEQYFARLFANTPTKNFFTGEDLFSLFSSKAFPDCKINYHFFPNRKTKTRFFF